MNKKQREKANERFKFKKGEIEVVFRPQCSGCQYSLPNDKCAYYGNKTKDRINNIVKCSKKIKYKIGVKLDRFYLIKDLKLIGRMTDYVPYLYNYNTKKWKVDNKNILMDRLMGYDEDSIGNENMLSKIEEVPLVVVFELIRKNNL